MRNKTRKLITRMALLLCITFVGTSSLLAAPPEKASADERKALRQLAEEIEGAIVYTRRGKVRKVTVGDWREVDLGDGDFARWGPLGQRIAVQHRSKVYVMNADGSNRREVVDGGVQGGDGCMIEFHTNGKEIIYGTRKDGLWITDIETRKKRKLNLPFNCEINISADGKHLVARRGDCYLVELPGTKSRKYAGGCSPCVSPDGTRMTSNKGGHRTMDIQKWNGKKQRGIDAKDMRPDKRWDNMHWSNHNDYLVMQGDGRNDESYIFSISKNKGWRMSWEGRTRYPDFFVSRDLKSGKRPMEMTLAWAATKGKKQVPRDVVASQRALKKKANSNENANSKTVHKRAAEVRNLTGCPTRVVWCQPERKRGGSSTGSNARLVGLCTEDGRGERVILSESSIYAKPIFTPDGERVVYSNRKNKKMYIVGWDGSNRQELGTGYASDVWRDPSDGVFWLYYRSGDGDHESAVMRQRLDNPEVRETVWDQTPSGHKSVPWFRLSADGTHFADAFPWSRCGVGSLISDDWKLYSKGCWPSLAPDNSYRFFVFNGNHRDVGFFDAGKKNYRKVDVAGGPGIDRKHEVYHPRWSNDVRFMTVTGPRGSQNEEVLLGRFNSDFTKIEKWARVSENDNSDLLGDAWLESGWHAKQNLKAAPQLAKTTPALNRPQNRDLSRFTKWPGDQRDLVFLWENNNATNQIGSQDDKPGRLCQAVARGNAVFGRFYEMDLSGGSVAAQEVDTDLLDACKRSNELTIEATIWPGNTAQGGPARIISFSKDSSARNFTLGQEKDTLVLRLRTPSTGSQGSNPQVDLCKVEAGRSYHVVVSYQPGRLTCSVNGKRVLESDRVRGDFRNWEPMHLVFGDEWNGSRDWSGSVEGIAIYSRSMSREEAEHKYNLFESRLRERRPIERTIVDAKLVEITPTPAVEDLQEYSRGIVVHGYEVLEGKEKGTKIQVAHWAILDRQRLPDIDKKQIGKVYKLQLEDFGKHPQLESERSFNDCEDFDVPLYYDIASRGVSFVPMAIAKSSLPSKQIAEVAKTAKIHLKVNCAGSDLGDWKSDDKYVVRNKSGNEFRFKRKTDTTKVRDPAPAEVYQTVRHRAHRYNFEVPNGDYLVRLHFADEHDPKGKIRKMDFVIENERALNGFNIVSAAGGTSKAVVKEIPVRVSDGNGLQIVGEDPKGGDVFVAGIEIVSR